MRVKLTRETRYYKPGGDESIQYNVFKGDDALDMAMAFARGLRLAGYEAWVVTVRHGREENNNTQED